MPNHIHEVRFSSDIYSLETIKRAAYRFSDKLSFNFLTEESSILCQISPVSRHDSIDAILEINHFKNEVLDQDLRQTIANETATMRNVILAHAFSKTGLQSDE
jgi:His-Xaa-Ser system protein HxsD